MKLESISTGSSWSAPQLYPLRMLDIWQSCMTILLELVSIHRQICLDEPRLLIFVRIVDSQGFREA